MNQITTHRPPLIKIKMQNKQKVALIVGGTSGIGHGIALTLAKAGHSVTIAGSSCIAKNNFYFY